MSESILESVFGKKDAKPYIIKLMWGSNDVEIPMRMDFGSSEQDSWREAHKNDFKVPGKKDEVNLSLYVAQLLKDFSQIEQFNLADVKELADDIDRNMPTGSQMSVTDWWNYMCGLTLEKASIIAKTQDFRQAR